METTMKLVKVTWKDIVADLHTDEDIVPCESWSVGWIQEDNDEYLRLYTGFYEDGIELADKIVIPKGCIVKIDNLKVTKDFFDD